MTSVESQVSEIGGRIAVFVNQGARAACDGADDEILEQLRNRLLGQEVVAVEADRHDDLVDVLTQAARASDLLVVGGGDGTVAAGAHAVLETHCKLAIIPLGTMNLLATDLGISPSIAEAVETIACGHTERIDVGFVNDRLFLNAVVFGVFSDLASEREKVRRHGPLAVFQALWRALDRLLRARPRRYTLSLPDRESRVSSRVIAVINNCLGQAPGGPFSRSRLDGGELEVYVSHDPGILALPALLVGMLLGRAQKADRVTRETTDKLQISPKRGSCRATVDGEVLQMTAPIQFELRPAAVTVVVPNAACRAARPSV